MSGTCRPYRAAGKRYWEYVFWLPPDTERGKRTQVSARFADAALKTRWSRKDDCLAAMAVERATRLKPGYFSVSHATLSAYMEEWFADLARKHPASTLIAYRNAWERLAPHLGTIPLDALGPLHIQRAIRTLQERDYRPGKRYAAGSIHQAHVVLGAALQQAVSWRLIALNPARGLIVPDPDPALTPIWTRDELRHFLRAQHDTPHDALWQLLADSMMRIGEALALTWADLDLESDPARVTVSKTLTRQRERTAWVVGTTTKTGDARTLHLSAATASALRRCRTRQKARRLACGPAWHDTGLVFDRGDGRLSYPYVVAARFETAVRAADLPRITPHGIRHTAATIAVQEGAPLKLVADRLGHGGMALVMKLYAHATAEGDKLVSETLARALDG